MRLSLVVLLGACGRIGFGIQPGDAVGTVDVVGDVGAAGVAGSGTISGKGCTGAPFDTIAAAYVLGNDESVGEPDVVLLDHAVPCEQLCPTSWDDTPPACETQLGLGPVPNGMQFVRLTFGGTAPGPYIAGAFMNPTPAQVHAVTYVTAIGGASPECDASGGTITLTIGGAMAPLAGTFAFDTGPGTLTGTFDAAWCPSGWYP